MLPSEFLAKYKWCQGELARDIDGFITYTDDPNAIKFCAMGVLCKTLGYNTENYLKYKRLISKHLNRRSLSNYNDAPERTKQDILSLFRAVEVDYVT